MRPYIWCHDRWPNLYHYKVTVTVRKSSVPNPGWQFRTFFFARNNSLAFQAVQQTYSSQIQLWMTTLWHFTIWPELNTKTFSDHQMYLCSPKPYLHKCQYLVQSVRNPNQPPCINPPIPITVAFHSTNYVLFSMGIRRAPLRGELRRFHRVFLPFCTIFSYSL